MTDLIPAEAFPAGEFLRDELEARNWSQSDFAKIIGRPAKLVSEIINNKKAGHLSRTFWISQADTDS